jgi:hypothetical protein
MPPSPTCPATISALAAAAAEAAPPANRDLKQYSRLEEAQRKADGQYMACATNSANGAPSPDAVGLDTERAFTEFPRA